MTDMLQKSENVAKNVANKNSQDLTEQWKKGELPEGHYYIKTRSETIIDEYIQWYKDHGIPSEKSFAYFNVQQVLAPVPSYEEWKKAYECVVSENEEITTLKELLKKANKFLKDYGFTFDGKDCAEAFKVHTKINEVLK